MRMHIELDEALIARVDEISGPRQRSAFVRDAIRAAVDQHHHWSLIGQSAGVIRDSGHDWDDDPAGWIRRQRFGDPDRVG